MQTIRQKLPLLLLALAALLGGVARASYNPTAGGSTLGAGYITGLEDSYASTTTVLVSPGSCRDSANAADITLSSFTTVSIASVGAGGLDKKTLTATCSNSASSTTMTFSASIVADLNPRTPVFTSFSTSGTTLTAVGTHFLRDAIVAVNDLVGNSVKGYSRVVSVDSETQLTLVAALPGGNAAGGSVGLVVMEQPVVDRVGSGGAETRYINTLSSDGITTIADTAWSGSSSAGTAANVGNVPPDPTASGWWNLWVVSGGSGTTCVISTQRTAPYGTSGYSTSSRRLGALWLATSSGTTIKGYYATREGTGIRHVVFGVGNEVASGLTSSTYIALNMSLAVPPRGYWAEYTLYSAAGWGSAATWDTRPRGHTQLAGLPIHCGGSAGSNMYWRAESWLDGAQYCDYRSQNANGNFSVYSAGYRENVVK